MPLLAGCGDNESQADLWNDIQIGEDIYHLEQVEFKSNDEIVCAGGGRGIVTLRLTLADGTAITRKHMLQCPEGYHADLDASQGDVLMTLAGSDGHDGDYRGVSGMVTIERHEFKTIIEIADLQVVSVSMPSGTTTVSHGYLSFDLTFF